MDIDHFDPRKKNDYIQSYDNLFLSKHACNLKKLANWPTRKDEKLGIKFLNPCKEQDYGIHIFEDPDTHEVWGDTPAGKYHVRMLGLNCPQLVDERKTRAKLNELINQTIYVFKAKACGREKMLSTVICALRSQFERAIPLIPYRKPPP